MLPRRSESWEEAPSEQARARGPGARGDGAPAEGALPRLAYQFPAGLRRGPPRLEAADHPGSPFLQEGPPGPQGLRPLPPRLDLHAQERDGPRAVEAG